MGERGGGRGGLGDAEFTQNQEVVEGALVHAVQARLVTVEKVELRRSRELAKSGGKALGLILLRAVVHRFLEQCFLNRPQPAEAPGCRHHIRDGALFDAIDRRQFGEMFLKGGIEKCLRFIGKDDTAGEESVPKSISGRYALPFIGFGAA